LIINLDTNLVDYVIVVFITSSWSWYWYLMTDDWQINKLNKCSFSTYILAKKLQRMKNQIWNLINWNAHLYISLKILRTFRFHLNLENIWKRAINNESDYYLVTILVHRIVVVPLRMMAGCSVRNNFGCSFFFFRFKDLWSRLGTKSNKNFQVKWPKFWIHCKENYFKDAWKKKITINIMQ